jgi:hypothetical protein
VTIILIEDKYGESETIRSFSKRSGQLSKSAGKFPSRNGT